MADKTYERALALFTSASDAEEAGDQDKALEFYQSAARLRFSPAFINLGNWYDDKADPHDPRRAVNLYKKAVALGDEVGAYSLAVHYRNLRNKRWHLYWLKRAAGMGYKDANAEIVKLSRARKKQKASNVRNARSRQGPPREPSK